MYEHITLHAIARRLIESSEEGVVLAQSKHRPATRCFVVVARNIFRGGVTCGRKWLIVKVCSDASLGGAIAVT